MYVNLFQLRESVGERKMVNNLLLYNNNYNREINMVDTLLLYYKNIIII